MFCFCCAVPHNRFLACCCTCSHNTIQPHYAPRDKRPTDRTPDESTFCGFVFLSRKNSGLLSSRCPKSSHWPHIGVSLASSLSLTLLFLIEAPSVDPSSNVKFISGRVATTWRSANSIDQVNKNHRSESSVSFLHWLGDKYSTVHIQCFSLSPLAIISAIWEIKIL